ncbi:MAG: CBS domain-containing protein [Silicimonas sp.]|jgi:CBS domain-containing protein|nr:CBS domain-containing protein [Silicimonas sp.]
MLVRQILGVKGGADVVTISNGASIVDAVRLLSEKRIGAVVVTDGDAPVGILSERDVVRELGRRGTGCLDDRVDSLMTREMVTCAPDESADQVLQKMTDGRFRHMPVMEDGAMAGLISIGDVVKARLSELSMEKDALEGMIKGF